MCIKWSLSHFQVLIVAGIKKSGKNYFKLTGVWKNMRQMLVKKKQSRRQAQLIQLNLIHTNKLIYEMVNFYSIATFSVNLFVFFFLIGEEQMFSF